MNVRNYQPADYEAIKTLLLAPDTFGGDFAEERDSQDRLNDLESSKPGSILVAEIHGEIVGTVTLFEDGRAAWLYRFAVRPEYEAEAAAALKEAIFATAKARGHEEVLVYAPQGNQQFATRYNNLGFNTGNDFTAYWQQIE